MNQNISTIIAELTKSELKTYFFLVSLNQTPVKMTNKEIAKVINIDPFTVSRNIISLTKKKYLKVTHKNNGSMNGRSINIL